jgi:hypothetical protein
MTASRVYLDDRLIYNAMADEYGEDGEIIDVYAPAVPSHMRDRIGRLVEIKLVYDCCEETRSGYFRFESVIESLREDCGVTMRFVW